MIAALCEHLWQSTLFAGGAWLATLALRDHRASVRHCVWFVASVKFLIPFSLLLLLGQTIDIDAAAPTRDVVNTALTIFAPLTSTTAGAALDRPGGFDMGAVFVCTWVAGSVVLAWRWLRAWLHGRAVLGAATPLDIAVPIPVKASPRTLEPAVLGVVQPVLLLPASIAEHFSGEQLHAIVAHELCHVERRDNLKAAVHMLVETLLWFHPLVWWIGARLLDERERACDEAVLDAGHQPGHYAQGVINVCRLFHGFPLLGATASGGDLEQRIDCILSERRPEELTAAQRALLGVLGMLIVAAPIAAGAMTSRRPPVESSSQIETLLLTASGESGGQSAQRISLVTGSLRDLIGLAYGTDGSQVRGDARWLDSRRYRLEVASSVDPGSYRALLTQLLAERFNLEIYVNRHCQHPCGRSEQISLPSIAAPLWNEERLPAQVRF